ncbi:MAG: hypothetical protein ABI240_15355 [Sphingomonas sp.]
MKLIVGEQDIDFHVASRRILSLVIIKEVFPSQGLVLLSAIRKFAEQGALLVVLDYPAFSAFVHHFPEERRFVTELEDFSRQVVEAGAWIDPQHFLLGRFLDRVESRD